MTPRMLVVDHNHQILGSCDYLSPDPEQKHIFMRVPSQKWLAENRSTSGSGRILIVNGTSYPGIAACCHPGWEMFRVQYRPGMAAYVVVVAAGQLPHHLHGWEVMKEKDDGPPPAG